MKSDALAFMILAFLLASMFNIATVHAEERRVKVYAVGIGFDPLVEPSTVYCVNRDYVAWLLDPSIKVNYPAAYEVRITIWQGAMPYNPWNGQGDVVFSSSKPYQDGELITTPVVDGKPGIWKYTVDVLNSAGLVIVTQDPHFEVTQAVGGIAVPVDKFGLLAPYIGLTSTMLVATVTTAVYVKRVKRRKEKQ